MVTLSNTGDIITPSSSNVAPREKVLVTMVTAGLLW